MNNLGDYLKFPEKKKSGITNQRQYVLKRFIDMLNSEAQKPLKPSFVAFKMSHLSLQEMKDFYDDCTRAKHFSKYWWYALRVDKN